MFGQETVNLKYKPRCKSIIFLSVEIFVMALPATLVWLYTLFTLNSGSVSVDQKSLYYFIIVASGFGLFSLWWLAFSAVRSVRRMVCKEVPILIKLGVGLGIVISTVLLLLSSYLVQNSLWAFWIFFGPLLLSIHLLVVSKPNTSKNA